MSSEAVWWMLTPLLFNHRLCKSSLNLFISHCEANLSNVCNKALFDGGTVASYLATVASFLSANPTEVLTLLLTNPESVSLTDVWAPLFEAAGLSSQAYVPSTTPLAQADWPTLGELIDAGTRLVVFMDYGAETGGVDYILPEFEMVSRLFLSLLFDCSYLVL